MNKIFVMLVLALAGCVTPPNDSKNTIEWGLLLIPIEASPHSTSTGSYIEVALHGRATLSALSDLPDHNIKLTLGLVIVEDPAALSSCSALQNGPPPGYVLQTGSTLFRQFDLTLKPGEVVYLDHTLRLTSTRPTSAHLAAVLLQDQDTHACPGLPSVHVGFK